LQDLAASAKGSVRASTVLLGTSAHIRMDRRARVRRVLTRNRQLD
jgi:hypothetical protein